MEYCYVLEGVGSKGCECLCSVRSVCPVTNTKILQVGLSLVEHDKRYLIADEYLRILYQ